jgi:hypothetical protein
MRAMRRAAILAAVLALAGAADAQAAGGPVPRGWGKRLAIGLADGPGGAPTLRASAPFGLRYQYLSGGVSTGDGWATWNPGGTFASHYVRESRRSHLLPVLTYYMVRQSLPGRDVGDEARADLGNLADAGTMRALFADLRLLFRRVGRARAVVHLEPDLWGYVQLAARGDDAASVPAAVARSGDADAAGLPDTAAGFARAVVRLRDRYAPHALLAWHLSAWGTGTDLALNEPSPRAVDRLAARAARFYRSLGARFDLVFTDIADRDAGYREKVDGAGRAYWWTSADFARELRFLRAFSRRARRRVAIWQIPLGNTLMRAMDDTRGHYQDNKVQWLLGSRSHERALRRAGVIGLLFGGGADGTTCACDALQDGETNPAPIDGNNRPSLSEDDDGGLFRALVRSYYRRGALRVR